MRKILLSHIILLISVLSWAQATGVPYSCSFEDNEDLSNWVWNAYTPDAKDQWIVGNMVHSEGRKALYISTDGVNPGYGSNPNIVVSYLRFKFPDADEQKNYDLSFDWKGIGDSTDSRLFVMVCPEITLNTSTYPQYLKNIASSTTGVLSNQVKQACEQLGPSREFFVCGSEEWQNVSLSNEIRVAGINSKRLVFTIVFIWVNNNQDETVKRSGICIDNLQIGSAMIKKPYNVTAEAECMDSTLLVSWDCSGAAREFEVQYRKTGTSTWRRNDGLIDGVEGFTHNGTHYSYKLQRIVEGTYDVRVRGMADTLITNFVYCNQVLVYCPENHCVDYIHLDNPNVDCTYGYHPNSELHTEDPYYWHGIIDFGPDSEESRHTIHVDPTETDPRTDDELFTVPRGSLASVRLGNWKKTGEAEAITYTITVDSANQGVLIVKYATVVEHSGHDRFGEPFFRLEVLDQNGELISQSCGHADFAYSDAEESNNLKGWHISKSNSNIAWKEWTTVGVNLQPYDGQQIKVRFTTSDCYQTAHYGYAYFTVDCANARLETENCGNDAKISCYAPDGFNYTWYNEAKEVVSTEQELVVDPGRQEYTCRVSFIEDPDCYFEVSTISAPRFPVPEYNFERVYGEPELCSSYLKFHNTSHVMTKYDGDENHTQEPCEDYHWYFHQLGTGKVTESYNKSPLYKCPDAGDSIEVTFTCYIGAENSCDSVMVDTIVVPNIIPDDTEFTYITCPETPINFGGQWFNKDTVYVGVFPNFAGCDSTSTLYLTVLPEIPDTYRHDSICSDGNVTINGVKYNEPMDNQLIMLQTVNGCDSALYMTLTVNQRLNAKVDTLSYVCADDEKLFLTFDIAEGVFDSLLITFSTPELRDTTIYDSSVGSVAIPYADTITPGRYTAQLVFYQFCCGTYSEVRNIELRYRSSIVAQKWNDVLTLLAPEYNGGYRFDSIQWYKNGVALSGETHSYLYQDLDTTADYHVELTRPDGVVMSTCPIRPVYHEQQTLYPTIVKASQVMPVYMEQQATVWYFTVSGQLYATFTLPQGYTSLTAPAQTGVYILKSVNNQGDTQAQVMIVE